MPDSNRGDPALAAGVGGASFAEGVAYLTQNRSKAIIAVITVPDAQRVKNVAENAGKTEQPNSPARKSDVATGEQALHPRAQRGVVSRPMVTVIKAK